MAVLITQGGDEVVRRGERLKNVWITSVEAMEKTMDLQII